MFKEKAKKVLAKRNKDIFFMVLAAALGVYLGFNVMEVIILTIFIGIILNPVPSRYLAAPALGFLVLTPFFLVFNQKIIAEQSAIYAYYFLIMAVIMGIYEIRKDRCESANPEKLILNNKIHE